MKNQVLGFGSSFLATETRCPHFTAFADKQIDGSDQNRLKSRIGCLDPSSLLNSDGDVAFSKKFRQYEKQKKALINAVKFLGTLSSSIAHEMRTSLTVISLNTELLEKSCNDVLLDNQATSPQKHLAYVGKHIDTIKTTITTTNHLISNLLQQIKFAANSAVNENAVISSENFELCTIATNIEKVLIRYPFQTEEDKNLVEFIKNPISDFSYFGNSILTTHLLFNLIKNALNAIKSSGKGKISIKLEINSGVNKLVFTDTASGISKKFLSKLFDLFSTTDAVNGNGVGLAFCKVVMQSYGGDITCNSVENEYTEFTLSFPRVLQQEQSKQVHITKTS